MLSIFFNFICIPQGWQVPIFKAKAHGKVAYVHTSLVLLYMKENRDSHLEWGALLESEKLCLPSFYFCVLPFLSTFRFLGLVERESGGGRREEFKIQPQPQLHSFIASFLLNHFGNQAK